MIVIQLQIVQCQTHW